MREVGMNFIERAERNGAGAYVEEAAIPLQRLLP